MHGSIENLIRPIKARAYVTDFKARYPSTWLTKTIEMKRFLTLSTMEFVDHGRRVGCFRIVATGANAEHHVDRAVITLSDED